jgi:Fe-S-cluster containining protein
MLAYVPVLSGYDRGNGECRYLYHNLCTIYDERPLICNIEEMYAYCFESIINKNDFYLENLKACLELTKRFKDQKNQKKLEQLLLIYSN